VVKVILFIIKIKHKVIKTELTENIRANNITFDKLINKSTSKGYEILLKQQELKLKLQ
jgi:hypothetical protein